MSAVDRRQQQQQQQSGDQVGVPSRGDSPQYSSSAGLSPPPSSPEAGSRSPPAAAQLANTEFPQNSITVMHSGVATDDAAPGPAPAPAAAPPVTRKRPGRKPGPASRSKAVEDTPPATEPPKMRKTRKPRDSNAAPVQRRRKLASSEGLGEVVLAVNPATQQQQQENGNHVAHEAAPQPSEASFFSAQPNAHLASAPQKGKTEDIITRPIDSYFSSSTAPPPPPQPQPQSQSQPQQPSQSQAPPPPPQQQPPSQIQQQQQQQHQQHQQIPPPQPLAPHQPQQQLSPPQPSPLSFPSSPQLQQPVRTSGQNYDPIRSNYDPVRETVVTHHHHYSNSQGSPKPPMPMNRASASPSISSLVDPPNQAMTSPSIATQSFFNQQQARLYRDEAPPSAPPTGPPSPNLSRVAPPAMPEASPNLVPASAPAAAPATIPAPTPAPAPAPAPAPVPAPAPAAASKKSENGTLAPSNNSKKSLAAGSTATSSAAASPKPSKAKDSYPTPPPLPGQGLMQLGDGNESRAPTIILDIPMAGETNKYINFTRLAEERYGWDALHPRLAAQRDRLARVAAAGAALEKNGSGRESGDEMSLDSEGEGSNIEMGGMSDARTGTDAGTKKVPKKRKMKEDEYDKDDDFVDDSELLWEEQAVAANDGFFVYSGPLVPEGAKPELDRADGPPKRGRGRGRGGSSRGGGPGSRGGMGAASRGGGPGSRGGTTTRKPRITKADRARMEEERLEREKMAAAVASMPTTYPTLASAASMGGAPMVFN